MPPRNACHQGAKDAGKRQILPYSERMYWVFQGSGQKKQAGVVVLTSDKLNFKPK